MCPTSTNQTAVKGYYGSIATMTCYACLGGCSDCNINLVMDTIHNPELQAIVCANDNYCSKGIQCTACLSGYSLVSGQCIPQSSCRLYSYYSKIAGSSPTNCYCLNGYYTNPSDSLSCLPCSIYCLTCNGSSINSCLSCSEGYNLINNTCQSSNIGNSYWNSYSNTIVGGGSIFLTDPTQITNCSSYKTYFGYKTANLTTSSTFLYTTDSLSSVNYYGISFKMKILFTENWDSSGGLYFSLNNPPTNISNTTNTTYTKNP